MEKMERKTIRVAIYCRMGREDPDHTMLEALSQKYYYSRRNADLSLRPNGTCRFLE